MKDNYGREINYLRVSLTQRCQLNCVYCGRKPPDTCELSPAEIEKAVGLFARCGIKKVRLTGGEPLMRSDIPEIVSRIKNIGGIEKVALTTNGIRLADNMKALASAGLDAVNVSLDSADREGYKAVTGSDRLDKVLEGISAAVGCGGMTVRINAVLMKGINDNAADGLIELAHDDPVDVRFIELMPFGGDSSRLVTGNEIVAARPFLKLCEKQEKGSPAVYYSADGYKGKIGFISPVSAKFCAECSRIRLLSDGSIRPCLGYPGLFVLRPYLDDEEKALEIIRNAILSKPAAHVFSECPGGLEAMNRIGG